MGIESTIPPEKLAALRAIPRPQVGEIVTVYWPAPDGAKNYAARNYNKLPNYAGLTLAVEPRLVGSVFQQLRRTATLADDVINLQFSEIRDREISRLFRVHGEGVKVEVFYYFPEVDLLVSEWSGHLRTPQRAGGGVFKVTAASGFRSANMPAPSRRHTGGCYSVIFGGLIDDLATCLAHDCPYAAHLGGPGNLGPDGNPYTTPANSQAECVARHGVDDFYLGFETTADTIPNYQTHGATLYAESKGNETALKETLRVVYGSRKVRSLNLLAYTRQFNNNHPDQGFVRALFEISEGRIRSGVNGKVNGALIGANQFNVRLGTRGQPRTSFSPNVNRYSRTALFFAVYGPVNPAQYGPGNLQAEIDVEGRDEVRVYAADGTFVEQYSADRAWCTLDFIRHPRFGHKLSTARFVFQDWIDLSADFAIPIAVRNSDGTVTTVTRSFSADLTERSAQQQINDLCLMAHWTPPFEHQGKWRILPLKKEPDLSAVPVFTDSGPGRNIIREKAGDALVTTVRRTVISDAELCNKIVLLFEDKQYDYAQRPLTFADQRQQLKAGQAMGDDTVREIERKYSAVGIEQLGEAEWIGNILLDLGEHDGCTDQGGGLQNNLEVSFKTWYGHALELHPYKVIKVVSDEIADDPFEYFRVKSIERNQDLSVTITAQAYNHAYYEQLESMEVPPPRPGQPGDPNPGGGPGDRPCSITIQTVDFGTDRIHVLLRNCEDFP